MELHMGSIWRPIWADRRSPSMLMSLPSKQNRNCHIYIYVYVCLHVCKYMSLATGSLLVIPLGARQNLGFILYLSCLHFVCSSLAICPWYFSGIFNSLTTPILGRTGHISTSFFFAPAHLFIGFQFETPVLINVSPTYIYIHFLMARDYLTGFCFTENTKYVVTANTTHTNMANEAYDDSL